MEPAMASTTTKARTARGPQDRFPRTVAQEDRFAVRLGLATTRFVEQGLLETVETVPGARAWKLDLGQGAVQLGRSTAEEKTKGAWKQRGDTTGLRYTYSQPRRLADPFTNRWKGH